MPLELQQIPEIHAFDGRSGSIRIPEETDIPLTNRVKSIIDTAEFRRLAKISQLGLVSLVYPAAHHSRFEHSLGVYRLSLLCLQQLANNERFSATISSRDAELFIVTSLLHDIGHWPFCRPIEDLGLSDVPRHEAFAERYICGSEISEILKRDFQLDPGDVVNLLTGNVTSTVNRLLSTILSGPIDVDKMDYLMRDSLHAGVPYGRNFDQARLISSLCLNQAGDGLAITEKGTTPAEMMVFARYVMFSEVYWHHAVRSATAMIQRAFFELKDKFDLNDLFQQTEDDFIRRLKQDSENNAAQHLLESLFGSRRHLFKRLVYYRYTDEPNMYDKIARRPYPWLVACSDQLGGLLSKKLNRKIEPGEILIDAPPFKLEVEFNIDVLIQQGHRYRPLGDVSPVVRTLAETQFDKCVKRVCVFAEPSIADAVSKADIGEMLLRAVDATESEH